MNYMRDHMNEFICLYCMCILHRYRMFTCTNIHLRIYQNSTKSAKILPTILECC